MIIRLFVNILFRLWFKSLWRNAPSIVTVRRRFALADHIDAIGRIDTKVEKEKNDGVDIEWVGSVSSALQRMIFYVHGGSFSVRAPLSDRRFCADLSRRTRLPVMLVAYRLAPEFQFPAGLDDCCRVYELLLQRGVASHRIVLLGHSAGANLALGMMMRAHQRGLPQPAWAVLLSPVTDFTASGSSVQRNAKRDVFMAPSIWPWAAAIYIQFVFSHTSSLLLNLTNKDLHCP